MSFDSPAYLIFLAAVFFLHRVCPVQGRWALVLAASLFFYACFSVPMTLLIVFVILLTYLAGIGIAGARGDLTRRLWLFASILGCMGLLFYFKYFNFAADAILRLAGGRWEPLDIMLPAGCSFYTFQALSYVVDVYRGQIQPVRHPGRYVLYVSFFPQLVAGPIERAGALLPQLEKMPTASRDQIRQGLRLMLSGLFRKLVIADLAAPAVDRVFALASPDGAAVAAGTLLFALQIYCDFAGYSEIAQGSALLLGIQLRRNFDRPYLARTVRGFWRRWHMSLTAWFTDYVYIPLGGSRRGLFRQCAATMTVFLLSGLWHGANWTFVLWGLWHGLCCTAEILCGQKDQDRGRILNALSCLVTLMFILPGWILFRASSLPQALQLFQSLFSAWHPALAAEQIQLAPVQLVTLALAVMQLPLLHGLGKQKPVSAVTCFYLAAAIALAWLLRAGNAGPSAFIYFQF